MSAFNDAGEVVAAASKAGALPEGAVAGLRGFVLGALDDEIIAPLCQEIETDLRVHIHSSQVFKVGERKKERGEGGKGEGRREKGEGRSEREESEGDREF